MKDSFDPKGRTGEMPAGLSGRDLAWQIASDDGHEDGYTAPGRTRRRVWPEDRVLPVLDPWHRNAECAKPEHAALDFMAQGKRQRARVIERTCCRCSAALPCLLEAILLERNDPHAVVGIRGGLTAEQRRELIATLPEPGVVYFGARDGLIKIGTSTQLNVRASVLGIGVLATEPGGYRRENELHRKFAHLRITERGEWFEPGPELLDYIESLSMAVAS